MVQVKKEKVLPSDSVRLIQRQREKYGSWSHPQMYFGEQACLFTLLSDLRRHKLQSTYTV